MEGGEVHALLGANGAGKSTLVKIISGAVTRDAGEIFFDGKPFDVRAPQDATDLSVASLYQEPALVPTLTVEQNIFLGREVQFGWGIIDRRGQRRRAGELLDQVAPQLRPTQLVKELRTSERQMVALAKALGTRAKLVIMDEPSASMTDAEIELLFGTIRTLRDGGRSIVYITHRLDEIVRICDRLTVLRDGRHIVTARTADIPRRELVELIAGNAVEPTLRRQRPPAGKTLLAAKGLSRRSAFSDITFEVHAGEIVGLAGLVGAGRSEIARALFGADPLDDGSIAFPSGDPRTSSPARTIAAGVAMVPEDRKSEAIVPAMSVAENILLSSGKHFSTGVIGLINRGAASGIVGRSFRRFNIKPPGSERRRIETLSGGNQQKAVLARAIESGAEVLILDEPTAGVDVGAKAEIHRHILDLATAGRGILLISSETEELLGLADRILVIREGRLIREIEGRSATSLQLIQSILGEHGSEAADVAPH